MRPIFLPRLPEMKPRTLWACQSVAAMMSASVAPSGALQHVEDDGLLAALARRGRRVLGGGILGRLGLLRRDRGRLWRGGGRQCLDGLPDPGDRRLAVRELLDRLEVAEGQHAGEGVPDLDEAGDGPVGGELGEFLLGGETILAFGNLLGGAKAVMLLSVSMVNVVMVVSCFRIRSRRRSGALRRS